MRMPKKISNSILVFILMLEAIQIPQVFTKKEIKNIQEAPQKFKTDMYIAKVDVSNWVEQVRLRIYKWVHGVDYQPGFFEGRKDG